ncbi:hypothetical protein ACFV2X_50075 [Streptomyces sp. NPDC059679]|uniref:hypothetical protein n=1 Tax=Streptomyces sp. NPDC059679 TaxID=3346903 RepID=UPI003699BF51
MSAPRRTLGTGPQMPSASTTTSPHRQGAAEADLAELPAIQLPDLSDLRNRGVLGAQRNPAQAVSMTRRPRQP